VATQARQNGPTVQSRVDIDETSDDSFPASDPPSFTPVTGSGSPDAGASDDRYVNGSSGRKTGLGQRWSPLWLVIAGAGAGVFAFVVRKKRRSRMSGPQRIMRPLRKLARRFLPS
jgi:hypothetical protein